MARPQIHGHFSFEVDGFLLSSAVPFFLAFSLRYLGTANSRMTEWWTRRFMAAAVVMGFLKIWSRR